MIGLFAPPPVRIERVYSWRLADGYRWADIERTDRQDREWRRWIAATELEGRSIPVVRPEPVMWKGDWKRPGANPLEGALDGACDRAERSGKEGKIRLTVAIAEGKKLEGSATVLKGRVTELRLSGDGVPIEGGVETARLDVRQRQLP